jgi:CelD/BcsL family acetyltransferase involved in cellulose biosynthesis
MRIKEINNYDDFSGLKDRWNDVLRRCDHSVFSTWEWLSTWWKYFGNNKRLVVLLAEENNEIIGIAPLMYSVYTMFGLRQGKIEFIGAPYSDYNDFILVDKHEECIKMFLDYLNNLPENWNCIELTDIPEDRNSLSILGKVSNSMKPVHKCPYTLLPKSYDVLLSKIKRKDRKELGRNLRRLEENAFKVDLVDYSGIHSVTKGINILFDLHQKRWESRGLPGGFADPNFRSFNLDIARRFAQEGWLGLYSLELSGKPVASLYGFKYMSKYYAYISGIDPTYYKYSIGNLLFLHVMAKCVQDELIEFDFMRGAETYKDRWNTIAKWNLEVIVLRRGFLSGFRHSLHKKYWSHATRLKGLLELLLRKI